MSFTPLKLDAVTLATVATPGTPTDVFGSVFRAGIDSNAVLVTGVPAGHPAPTMGALGRIAPVATFSTSQFDIAMNGVTAWGKQCSARLWQKNSTGAAPASRAGTTNKYKSIASAVAFWTGFTLPHSRSGQVGTVDFTVLAAYNGSVSPVVDNTGAALISTALNSVNFFAAGPFYLNGSLVAGIQTVSGMNQTRFSGEGDADSIFDTYVEGTTERVIVMVTTLSDTSWTSTLPATGLAVTNATFFARKYQDGALITFEADGTAEHVKFVTANAVAYPISSQAVGQDLYLSTFALCCVAPDATNPPLPATVSSAIAAP